MPNGNQENQILLIGVAGPSGAGKTTLVTQLREQHPDVEHIHLDNYLKDPDTFPKIGHFINWEAPGNIKFELLREHLLDLKSGKQVKTQTFPDYLRGNPPREIILEPKKYVIAEGFLLLTRPELRDLLDIKIYLDMPLEEVLPRRMQRMRGAVDDPKIIQYIKDYTNEIVVPQYREHGIFQKEVADFIVDAKLSVEREIEILKKLLRLEE